MQHNKRVVEVGWEPSREEKESCHCNLPGGMAFTTNILKDCWILFCHWL